MTWEELKEKAKEMGYTVLCDGISIYDYDRNISFSRADGKVCACFDVEVKVGNVSHFPTKYAPVLAMDRTPEQMLAIMKALR